MSLIRVVTKKSVFPGICTINIEWVDGPRSPLLTSLGADGDFTNDYQYSLAADVRHL